MKKTQLAKAYVKPDEVAANSSAAARSKAAAAAASGAVDDEALSVRIVFGAEHTAWRRDRISPSMRARRLLEKIKPFLIRVLSFWDHRITRLSIEGRDLFIDASGSYQVV